MMITSYVTYDTVTGELLGGFMQTAPTDGTPYLPVSDAIRLNWPAFRMNAARDAIELIPPTAPLPPTREQLKQTRQAVVDAITVTVNGKVFDGDEISQGRMARALKVADITGQTSCTWVLHDNTAAQVTREDLAQALSLAMQAQGTIWVIQA